MVFFIFSLLVVCSIFPLVTDVDSAMTRDQRIDKNNNDVRYLENSHEINPKCCTEPAKTYKRLLKLKENAEKKTQ